MKTREQVQDYGLSFPVTYQDAHGEEHIRL